MTHTVTPPLDGCESPRELEQQRTHDADPAHAFDDLTSLAARVCGTPLAIIEILELVEADPGNLQSADDLETQASARESAFCAHAIRDPQTVLIVEDAQADERFRHAASVAGEHDIRLYAGVPLVTSTGKVLGTLCVIDREPRRLDEGAVASLRQVARQVASQLELRRTIHELDRARIAAESAASAKARFLADMSHELRTPMNAILGMAELLRETPLTAEQAQYIDIFRNSGRVLLELINDILDLSKAEAGKLELRPTPVNLRSYLKSVLEPLVVDARRKQVAVELVIDPDLPACVRADELRLRQVLVNLVGNAIKFTDYGRVVLRVAVDDADRTRIKFAVRDTGIGIAPHQLAQLFQPYAQADSTIAGRFGGTGLGLSLSQQFVRLMGGEVAVESNVGIGSTFWFSIGLQVESSVASAPKAAASLPITIDDPTAAESVRVLLVDDSQENRFLVQNYLKHERFAIDCVADGLQAVAMFRAKPYDIVLMDGQLPGCSGYEATEAIRAWERDQQRTPTPILALTADAMQDDRRRAVRAGCDAHLSKPIMKRTLLDAIETYTGASVQRPASGKAEDSAIDDIAALRPEYLSSVRNDLGILLGATESADLATIKRLAHNMKGTGASFGFPDITTIGDVIEQAAKQSDMHAASTAIGRLRDFLESA